MDEAIGMSALGTMDRAIRAYADQPESWKVEHDEVQSCWALEDLMLTGRVLFRALCELDAGLQVLEMKRRDGSTRKFVAGVEELFRIWLEASESGAAELEKLLAEGHEIDGCDEFLCVLEEGRATVGNLDLEARLPSAEVMRALVRPENPDPTRYGN